MKDDLSMKPFQIRHLLIVVFMVASLPVVASAQIEFDRPKTEQPLENPYTIGVTREQILETAKDALKKCNIPIDEELSKANEGKLITKPVIFSRGVTTRSDLEYLAIMPASDVRNWTQGRFYLEITALPLDQKRSQLFVSAHIQGRIPDTVIGNKWIDGQSNGRLEDEVIRGLASKLLGIDLGFKKGGNPKRILNCEY